MPWVIEYIGEETGFGGREVRYIGAWDLVLDGFGHRVYGTAVRSRTWLERRRHGLSGGPALSADQGEAT